MVFGKEFSTEGQSDKNNLCEVMQKLNGKILLKEDLKKKQTNERKHAFRETLASGQVCIETPHLTTVCKHRAREI